MEEEYYLPFESETYTAHATSNVDFDTDILDMRINPWRHLLRLISI
jgi:hypothetical protein